MGHETLLIVEDNHVLRDGLRDILTCEGYAVLTSSNGQEALQQMDAICPDLILSDIAMPKMDGYSFFRAVRSKSDWVTIPFVFLTARGGREDILNGKNLGAEDYLVKPLTREELVTAVRARLARSHELRMAQLQNSYETSLAVLANAIDVRDPYTRGHVERVTEYSQAIALELGWQGRLLEKLRYGAILHDVGKIMIRETTLFKDGTLDDEEWEEIKRHPLAGAEMIRNIPYLAPAIPIVRHHHERWDGQGYPDGLAGREIPLAARIVAVADGFDAMTTDRPYRSACTLERGYEEMLCCAGTQFDPEIVTIFSKIWNSGKIQHIREKWEAENGKH